MRKKDKRTKHQRAIASARHKKTINKKGWSDDGSVILAPVQIRDPENWDGEMTPNSSRKERKDIAAKQKLYNKAVGTSVKKNTPKPVRSRIFQSNNRRWAPQKPQIVEHKTHAQYKSENPVTFTECFNSEGAGDGKPVKVYRKPGAVSVDRRGTGGIDLASSRSVGKYYYNRSAGKYNEPQKGKLILCTDVPMTREEKRSLKEIRRAAKKAIRMEKRHAVKLVKAEHDPKVNAKLERRWSSKGLLRAA